MKRVRKRKRDIVNSFRAQDEQGIAKTKNLDLIYGEAAFTGPKSLRVQLRNGGEQEMSADLIFINAGMQA